MNQAIEIDNYPQDNEIDYSICTLVTNHQQYQDMLGSYRAAGFDDSRCEFIYLDNSQQNKYDAYVGINKFLRVAKGKYIILCHQDLLLHDHDIHRLDEVIKEMDAYDDCWAILGNAGGMAPGQMAIRITDPCYGPNTTIAELPAKVGSLDENFILLKADANLGVSKDIKGFHFYGTDLCIMADILGYNAYVVDFHLHHIGGETIRNIEKKVVDTSPSNFNAMKAAFIKKYQRAYRPRWIQTTCTIMHISGSGIRNLWANRKFIFSVQKRINRWFG